MRYIGLVFVLLGVAWCINWFLVDVDPAYRVSVRIIEMLIAFGVTASVGFVVWLRRRA